LLATTLRSPDKKALQKTAAPDPTAAARSILFGVELGILEIKDPFHTSKGADVSGEVREAIRPWYAVLDLRSDGKLEKRPQSNALFIIIRGNH
jgi:hypothetical protein